MVENNPLCSKTGGSSLSLLKMRRTMIYIPNPSTDLKGQASQQNEYDQVGTTVPPSNTR